MLIDLQPPRAALNLNTYLCMLTLHSSNSFVLLHTLSVRKPKLELLASWILSLV